MISIEELRNMSRESKYEKLNFFEIFQLKSIERKIKKKQKKGETGDSISVGFRSDSVIKKLKGKGYKAYYYRARWTNGIRIIISWDK